MPSRAVVTIPALSVPGRTARAISPTTSPEITIQIESIRSSGCCWEGSPQLSPCSEPSQLANVGWQNLSKLVLKKAVVVEWGMRDRNKRIVGKIMLDETGADCAFRSCIKSLDAGLRTADGRFAATLAAHRSVHAGVPMVVPPPGLASSTKGWPSASESIWV